MSAPETPFSLLPSIDSLLAHPDIAALGGEPRPLARAWAREALEGMRREIRAGAWVPATREEAERRAVAQLQSRWGRQEASRMRAVWNASGILLHTNLGRAALPAEARRALLEAADGHCSLEIDLDTGRRGSRLRAIRELVPLLTGAEAGIAVNNCAGALFLAMAAMARGLEVLVSRGQLVEIGGSFRIPEILEAAGARLREVGTTNRTRISDYRRGRTRETALVLRAHRSNFQMTGFCEEPGVEELASFCRKEGLPLVDDLGSGALRAHADLFPGEPCIEDSIQAGADLVSVSADKLLGLGQAGILAGRSEWIDRLARHPIARVVRLDKTLVAALEAGFRIHLAGPERARQEIPLLRALSRPAAEVAEAAERCARRLRDRLPREFEISTLEVRGEVGGGSLPGREIVSHAVAIRRPDTSAEALAGRLRGGRAPVLGRIQADRLLLDPRGIEPEQEEPFVEAVAEGLLSEDSPPGRDEGNL